MSFVDKGKFTIINKVGAHRGKTGYLISNENDQIVGIAFKSDDKRTARYGNAEACVFSEFKTKYGEWGIIKPNNEYLPYERLKMLLDKQEIYKLY